MEYVHWVVYYGAASKEPEPDKSTLQYFTYIFCEAEHLISQRETNISPNGMPRHTSINVHTAINSQLSLCSINTQIHKHAHTCTVECNRPSESPDLARWFFASLCQNICKISKRFLWRSQKTQTAVIQYTMTPISGVNNSVANRGIPTAPSFPPHWSLRSVLIKAAFLHSLKFKIKGQL